MPDKFEPKNENKADTAKAEAGEESVQSIVDEETRKGFRGVAEAVDPTPNENYTVAGVTSGKPTPETDEEQAKKAGSRKQFHI